MSHSLSAPHLTQTKSQPCPPTNFVNMDKNICLICVLTFSKTATNSCLRVPPRTRKGREDIHC